jgi:hypothetical protein
MTLTALFENVLRGIGKVIESRVVASLFRQEVERWV